MDQDLFAVDIRPGSSTWKQEDVAWFRSLVEEQLPLRKEVKARLTAHPITDDKSTTANSNGHNEEKVDLKCMGFAAAKSLASSLASEAATAAPSNACNKKSKAGCIHG